ncbi:MAG: hypothetical protein ACI9CA_000964, partial [Natronomonas sp.]
PDDHGVTYLADASLLDLFERARADMPDWFADQVDRLSEPDLPAFAPGEALGGSDGSQRTGGRSRGRSRSRTRSRGRSRPSGDHPLSDVWD